MMKSRVQRSVLLLSAMAMIASLSTPVTVFAQSSGGCDQASALQNSFKKARLSMLTDKYNEQKQFKKPDLQKDYQLSNDQNTINSAGGTGDMFKSAWPMLSKLLSGMGGMGGLSKLFSMLSGSGSSGGGGGSSDCSAQVSSTWSQVSGLVDTSTNASCVVLSSSCSSQIQTILENEAGSNCGTMCSTQVLGVVDSDSNASCVSNTTSCTNQIATALSSLSSSSCASSGSGGSGGSGGGSGGSSGASQSPGLGIPSPQSIIGSIGSTTPCSRNLPQPTNWMQGLAPTK